MSSRSIGARAILRIGLFGFVKLDDHLCLGCGYVESYIADLHDWRDVLARRLPKARGS